MDIRSGDVNLGAIPMSHSYGFSNLVTPLLVQGTPIVISNDYLPQSVMNLCNEFADPVAPLIPMVFDHLVTAAAGEFSSIRTFCWRAVASSRVAKVSRTLRDPDPHVLWLQRMRRHHLRPPGCVGRAGHRRSRDGELLLSRPRVAA